jgi:thiol-disulfide isomerase/thioredoxin
MNIKRWIPRLLPRGMTFLISLFVVSQLHAAALDHAAPKFSLANSQNQIRSLSDYKGKIVFINFWASWCAPCQEELPELDRLAAQYKGKKVRVVAINVDPKRPPAKKLLAKLGLTSPHLEVLWDSKSKVVGTYNIDTMPSSYILDSRGIIRFSHSGFHSQDPDHWRREIDRLITRTASK